MDDDGGWAAIAAWYDAKQGDRGDLWHRYLIDPALLDVVGNVRGLRVLDMACGNGYLSRRFAREGALKVVGVDASRPIVERARKRELAQPLGVRYLIRDVSHLGGLADDAFDLVISNMAVMDLADAAGAIQEAGRVTRPGGRFVFSISHPCFDLDQRSLWVVERGALQDVVWRKVSGYRQEDAQRSPWRVGEGEFRYTASYHRTLSTYSRYLRRAGFAITRMEEPSPRPRMVRESPMGTLIAEIPLHLVVEAVRLPNHGPTARGVRQPGSRTSERTLSPGARRSGSRGRTRGTGSGRRDSNSGS
jgi:ubiquinone/menaquinone biosynthesis C-methylase UbiE